MTEDVWLMKSSARKIRPYELSSSLLAGGIV